MIDAMVNICYNKHMKNTAQTQQNDMAEYLIMQTLIQAHKAGKKGLRESEIFAILGLDHDSTDDPFMSLSPDVLGNLETIEALFESKISTVQ